MLAASSSTLAGELEIRPSVSVSYVTSDVTQDITAQERSSDIYTLSPTIASRFTSSRLDADLLLDYQLLDRQFDSNNSINGVSDSRDTFTNYNYGAQFEAIENFLFFDARGTQRQQSISTVDQLNSDLITDSDNLTKTSSHTLGFNFLTPTSRYVSVSLQGNYSDVSTDQTFNAEGPLDNTNLQLNGSISSGDKFRNTFWTIQSNYTDTERSQNNDNFISQNIFADFGFEVYNNLAFVVTSQFTENKLEGDGELETNDRTFDTYGAGFEWRESRDRRFRVTYNRTSNSDQGDDNFVGVDLDWAFSRLTNIRAQHTRRFFGKATTFSLTHNTRTLRNRIQYTENVTTFSRLFLNEQSAGVFVCPPGAADVSSCFLPDSLDYQLQNGEQFLEFTTLLPEISDQITLTKSLVSSVGYSLRRLSGSIQYRRTETQLLNETELALFAQDRITDSINASVGYRIGAKTSINLNTTYTESERTDIESNVIDDEIVDVGLNVDYRISQTMSANFSYRVRNADSDDINIARDEDRLTLTFRYVPSSR